MIRLASLASAGIIGYIKAVQFADKQASRLPCYAKNRDAILDSIFGRIDHGHEHPLTVSPNN